MAQLLVVDDEKSIRLTLAEFLRVDGHTVRVAATAAAALQLLAEEPADVIISDIVLPQTTGVELLRRLREVVPRAQVLMMTGEPTVDTAAACLRAGAFDYLIKPLTKGPLLQVVRQAVRLKAMDDERMRLVESNRQYQQDLEKQVECRTTELRQSEQRVREQYEELELLYKYAPVGLFAVDRDLRYVRINERLAEINGFPVSYHLGRTVRQVLPGLAERLLAIWVPVLERGEAVFNCEVSGETPTLPGQRRHWLSNFLPWRSLSGEIIGLVGSVLEVTEQKRMESQFLRAQRLESVGRLASGIAHDLNNILSPIMMATSMLRDEARNQEDLAMLDTIDTNARRGAEIVKQVLTFARGSEGPKIPVALGRLVRELGKVIRETFPKAIHFETEIQAHAWSVLGDNTHLYQLLLNLCVNAADAMPTGGRLKVTLENITVDEPFVRLNPGAQAGPHVCLTVADTGTGIPPELLDKIFDPFFTTKSAEKGTGLGLATVIGIVKGHGGFIQVGSRLDQGTQFRIYLPALPEKNEAAAGEMVSSVKPPPGGQKVVLVVDDEECVRDITRRTLEKHGYTVLLAADGIQAITLLRERVQEIKMVITDMSMPLMDGEAVIRAIRQMDADLPVVAMSGLAPQIFALQLEGLHIQHILTKPFSSGDLLQAVTTVLHPQP
jgi:PAS domain S-box-containing protein